MSSAPIDVSYQHHLLPAILTSTHLHNVTTLLPLLLCSTLAWFVLTSPACANIRTFLRHGTALPGISSFGPPIIGAALLFVQRARSLPAVLARLTALGGADGIAYSWVGLNLIVAIDDPVISHEILRRAEKSTRDGNFNLVSPISSIRRILGETIFTHDNATTKKIKDWTHALVGQRKDVAEYNSLIMDIASKHVSLFVREHDPVQNGRCSVHDMIDDFAADMWCQIWFGVKVDSEQLRNMCATVTNMNGAITQPLQLLKHALWAAVHPLQSLSGKTDPVETAIQDTIQNFVRGLIAQGINDKDTPLPPSIISKLRASHRSGLSDAEVDEELYDLSRSIIFAGFQSTRRWIGWTLTYLQQHPDILVELRHELATLGMFELDSLRGSNKMQKSTTLFDAVLEEVGRLHAPTFAKFRVLADPTELTTRTGKSVRLEKDTLVV
jgi:cytochrome P450